MTDATPATSTLIVVAVRHTERCPAGLTGQDIRFVTADRTKAESLRDWITKTVLPHFLHPGCPFCSVCQKATRDSLSCVHRPQSSMCSCFCPCPIDCTEVSATDLGPGPVPSDRYFPEGLCNETRLLAPAPVSRRRGFDATQGAVYHAVVRAVMAPFETPSAHPATDPDHDDPDDYIRPHPEIRRRTPIPKNHQAFRDEYHYLEDLFTATTLGDCQPDDATDDRLCKEHTFHNVKFNNLYLFQYWASSPLDPDTIYPSLRIRSHRLRDGSVVLHVTTQTGEEIQVHILLPDSLLADSRHRCRGSTPVAFPTCTIL